MLGVLVVVPKVVCGGGLGVGWRLHGAWGEQIAVGCWRWLDGVLVIYIYFLVVAALSVWELVSVTV